MQGAATLVTDPDVDGTPAVAVDFNVTGIRVFKIGIIRHFEKDSLELRFWLL